MNLYRLRPSLGASTRNRPKRPGLVLANQPKRATLIRDALWEALRERGLDTGLEVFPAKITNYASPYLVIAPRVRLLGSLSGVGGPVIPCETCGGSTFGHVPEPVFHPPSEAQGLVTNVIRDPSVVLVVSKAVRDFFATSEGERLLAPSKILPLPEFEPIKLTSPREDA